MVAKTRARVYDPNNNSETRQRLRDGEQRQQTEDVHGRTALFQPIADPILRSFDPRKVSAFLREYTRYKNEVEEKRKEIPSMTVASFKVCIERSRLEGMHFMGKFDEIAPDASVDDLTSDHIEEFIRSVVTHEGDSEVDPTVIEDALKGIKVPMTIVDPQARIMEFVNDFFERLESVGYGDFKGKNPGKTVKLIQSYLYPPILKSAMVQHLEYQENLKENIRTYLKILMKEATVPNKVEHVQNKAGDRGSSAGTYKRAGNSRKRRQSSAGESEDKNSTTGEKQLPHCLNPECDGKHRVKDCPRTSKELAKKLFKEFFDTRQKAAKRVGNTASEKNSTRIMGTFGGIVHSMMCTDIGSDINLMSETTLCNAVAWHCNGRLQFTRPCKAC